MGDRNGEKPWEKPGSFWRPVLLWPDKTSMVLFNSRLQHRSDCAEDLSGSRGLVPMVVELMRSSQGICLRGPSSCPQLILIF